MTSTAPPGSAPHEHPAPQAGLVHPNHRYVVAQALALAGPGARVLDYGCGAGEIVVHGRSEGLDIVGADVFYEGARSLEMARESGLLGQCVFEMERDRTPFPDASFDMVCANQVFEHVKDIDRALAEIRRVLKPGGVFLNLFPSVGVLREGHCGVPFAHWLTGAPALQRPYLRAASALGMGYFKEGKSYREWAAFFSDWLRDYTTYRSKAAIHRAYRRHFASVAHLEGPYFAYRLEQKGWGGAARLMRLPGASLLGKLATEKLGGMVILAR
jgi:SAM-dependent methyltransferase